MSLLSIRKIVPVLSEPTKISLQMLAANLRSLDSIPKEKGLPAVSVLMEILENFTICIKKAKDCVIEEIESFSDETIALHLKILQHQERKPGISLLNDGNILTKDGIAETSSLASKVEADLVSFVSEILDSQLNEIEELKVELRRIEKKYLS